jgi:hypothetical protein
MKVRLGQDRWGTCDLRLGKRKFEGSEWRDGEDWEQGGKRRMLEVEGKRRTG